MTAAEYFPESHLVPFILPGFTIWAFSILYRRTNTPNYFKKTRPLKIGRLFSGNICVLFKFFEIFFGHSISRYRG
jgi:hypothetical protein